MAEILTDEQAPTPVELDELRARAQEAVQAWLNGCFAAGWTMLDVMREAQKFMAAGMS